MKPLSRSADIQINSSNPFEFDKFESEKEYKDFISLLEMTSTPFVYALTAPWGSGKSTFIKMCSAQLVLDGYTSFVINVWNNDHLITSNTALLSHLQTIIVKLDSFSSMKNHAGDLFDKYKKPIIGLSELALKVFFRNTEADFSSLLSGFGLSTDSSKDVTEGLSKMAIDSMQFFNSRTDLISELKSKLQDIVDNHVQDRSNGEKPIIIFIDELDRCLPNDVIRFLDSLKHVFELRNVIFVLAIDDNQLKQSVISLFGKDMSINGYLNKYINAYYKLDHRYKHFLYFRELFNTEPLKSHFFDKDLDEDQQQILNKYLDDFHFFTRAFLPTPRGLNALVHDLIYFKRIKFDTKYIYFYTFVLLFKTHHPNSFDYYFCSRYRYLEFNDVLEKLVNSLDIMDYNIFNSHILPWFIIFHFPNIKDIRLFLALNNNSDKIEYSAVEPLLSDRNNYTIFAILRLMIESL